MPLDPVGFQESQLVRDLRAARALIDTPGKWIQNRSSDGSGAYCSSGAIWAITKGVQEEKSERYMAASATLSAVTGNVIDWNDTPGRTHAEVMDAFDCAIANADATVPA